MTPQYIKLKNAIKESIEAGTLAPGMRIPPRHDMMRQHSLARATVDRAINELVRDGLLSAKRGAGTYVVDARQIKQQRIVAYIVLHRTAELSETALFPFLDTLRTGANHKYRIEFISIYDMAVKPERFLGDARSFVLCQLHPSFLETVDLLRKKGSPVLLLNRWDQNFDYLTTDNFLGAQQALDQCRAQKVGLVTEYPSLNYPYRMERIAAFYRAVAVSGRTVRPDWHIYCSASDPENGIKEIFRLLSSGDRPEVLLVSGYLIPYVLSAVHAQRLKLGADITLIHFDPKPETAGKKGVIWLEQNFHEMGRKTLEWIEQNDGRSRKRLQLAIAPRVHGL